jgi:hypothetical protein
MADGTGIPTGLTLDRSPPPTLPGATADQQRVVELPEQRADVQAALDEAVAAAVATSQPLTSNTSPVLDGSIQSHPAQFDQAQTSETNKERSLVDVQLNLFALI